MLCNALMLEALDLARRSGGLGEVPVGAVVADAGGKIIGRGRNSMRTAGVLAHAEVEAVCQAANSLDSKREGPTFKHRKNSWNLQGCTLVVTLEPCPMCAGAVLQTHLDRVVFGAWDPKLGACGSVWDLLRDPHIGSKPEVIGGVYERQCADLLAGFFSERR